MRQETHEPIRLSGGTTLVVVPDSNAPASAIAVSVRISAAEQRRQLGVGAILARMLGGDSQGRTPELLSRDVEGFGALGTNYDGNQLLLWSICPPTEADFVEATKTLLLNTLTQPRFTAEALEQARRDQLRALALWEEELTPRLLRTLEMRARGSELNPQGDDSSLRRLSVADVQSFYNRFCTPERTTVAVVGKFSPEVARRWVETSLNIGDWGQRPPGVKEQLPAPEPIPAGLRDLTVRGVRGVSGLAVGYLSAGLAQPEGRADWAALLLLDATLGLGKAGRLFRLRDEKALAYEVRSTLMPGRDHVLWAAWLLGNQDPDRMKEGLLKSLENVIKAPPTEVELERARAILVAQRQQNRQLVLARARALAWAESSGVGAPFEQEFLRRIEAVKRSDVERVARTLFSGSPAVVRMPSG